MAITERTYPGLVAATGPHLRAAYDLLKEASEVTPHPRHRRRLVRLAELCEGSIAPLIRLADVLEAEEKQLFSR
jgi:hypothetical protein